MMSIAEPRRSKIKSQSPESLIFRQFRWHATAPRDVARAADRQDGAKAWQHWKRHLATRTLELSPHASGRSEKLSPLFWGIASLGEVVGSERLLSILHRAARGKKKAGKEAVPLLATWLARADVMTIGAGEALECLAWAYALPALAESLPQDEWWDLLRQLLDVVTRAARLEAHHDPHHDPLVSQLIGTELPLVLSTLFPEILNCRRLRKPARALLQNDIARMASPSGLPTTLHFSLLHPLVASWTRSLAVVGLRREKQAHEVTLRQFGEILVEALRWTRADGMPLFADAASTPDDPAVAVPGARNKYATALAAFWDAAVAIDGSASLRRLLRACQADRPRRRGKPLPLAGNSSETIGTAIVRSDWSRGAAVLGLIFKSPTCGIDFLLNKVPMLRGTWEFELRRGNHVVAPRPDARWEETCWETSGKAQYLEWQLELEHGLRIERSALLAPKDEFLLLADTVVGPEGMPIDYFGRLPLARGAEVKPADETREVKIACDGVSVRVLPLELPEWRSDPRGGRLESVGQRLEHRISGPGGSLNAPLLIDLSPRRRKQPLTWRQLTVAESRLVMPRDVAVGYRVEIGDWQWLIYRSVSRLGNRTVLGQNLSSELVIGRFNRDGSLDTLMEIL
ncbi:MAG: hypothetical protein K8T25_22315 [Planctomycetia bacterium]|nr:hypothetical protein [Planctomycetia bacterium]